VDQGWGYYNRFIKTFPDIHKLARATDAKVFKLWEGLGYYTRCRNLLATARYISKKRRGVFPDSYETIKALKGIGPYTAAAISSFAFNLPHAVLDGNVFRVLARLFGIATPTDTTEGKKYFTALAEELLDKKQPGLYNQAIMDFGAVVCKPAAPLCSDCVFKKYCFAFKNDMTAVLPVKEKKIVIKQRWFYFFVIEYKNDVAIVQRTAKDIWKDLYEFPLVESTKALSKQKIIKSIEMMGWFETAHFEVESISPIFKQQLSHQLISGQFIEVTFKRKMKKVPGWEWVSIKKFKQFAFPQFINQYLKYRRKA
jgi:A/G-specific adenine glycosylase